ncbi:MAG: Rpn family recombination-promoting nuclease/putative transposase [Paludibacteraceae bacterium]|nr:Rpn family recombination-promoting nuclease/putative transposase [Paludibacteraceae bacterium]
MRKSPNIEERYLNLATDFAFKKIFGTEANKKLLIHFLNCLLDLKRGAKISDVKYLNTEQQPKKRGKRRAIFDVYCETNRGERFIVEMQKNSQKHFKDRSVFYSTFPIQEISEKTKSWDFQLPKIYVIGVLSFTFNTSKLNKVIYKVQLKDDDNEVFYENLNFVYIEIPKFRKRIDELETFMDKWLFLIKNLHCLKDRPVEVKNKIFNRLFSTAEVCNLNEFEFMKYSRSLKDYRDWHNTLNHAIEKETAKISRKLRAKYRKESREEGRKEGLAEGRAEGLAEGRAEGREEGLAIGIETGRKESKTEMVKKLLDMQLDIETIAKASGLTFEEILALKK